MTIQTTSTVTGGQALSNAITTRYTTRYLRGAQYKRLYDQLAMPVGAPEFELETRRGMGSTYTFNFISEMAPATAAMSEVTDVTPQVLRDATATITPTSRVEALKWSQLVDIEAYTDYVAARAEIVGANCMESIDNLAKDAALQGGMYVRAAARSSLDAGSSGHRWLPSKMLLASTQIQALRCPPVMINGSPRWIAIGHPDAFNDLIQDGVVNSVALYQDKEIVFNQELGQFANFKIIISPWAKIFGAAGADAGDGSAKTTLSAALNALSTSMTVAASTSMDKAKYLTVGTIESSTTYYDTNEVVWNKLYQGSASTTVTFVGMGSNGGCRFDHASGASVYNSDNVYPVIYGSPFSLVKVYANEIGEFGQMVGPKWDGLANQFQSLAWKYVGGYGLISDNRILRGEYSASVQSTA